MVQAKPSAHIALIREGEREAALNSIFDGTVFPELIGLDELALHCSNIYEPPDQYDPDCMLEGKRFKIPGWTQFPFTDEPKKPKFHYKVKGLQYEVWTKKRDPGGPLVLIVFRGTDPTQLGDWISNLRWVTRYIPLLWDQYDQARVIVPRIVEHVKKEFGPDVEIAAAGHSLGGGLAQQAGYISKDIKTVYAFDSSTVTGYYSVKRKLRNQNKIGMRIFRIYEHGEILAYLRMVMKAVYPVSNKDPKIVEIRFNFQDKGNFVNQHSMKRLACNLYARARSE